MRLLQLPTGRDQLLDFHPNMTVVQGLDDGSHQVLVEAVAGLARGECPLEGGLLEAHGVLFELRADLLALFDTSPDDLDTIVRAGDLPTKPLTVDGRELRAREHDFEQLLARIAERAERLSQARGAAAAATAAVDQARRARGEAESGAARRLEDIATANRRLDQLTQLRRRVDEQLSELHPEKGAADAVRQEVENRTAPLREAAQVASARQAELETALEQAMAARDPESENALRQAQADLQALIAALQAEQDAAAAAAPAGVEDPPVEVEPVAQRLERLEARLAELDRVLVAVAAVDPSDVAEALALLQGGDSMEQIAVPEALALADELDSIPVELGEDVTEPLAEESLSGARERLDDARQALLEATQAVRNPELDRDEVDRLEDAHDALLDAIDKADARFAGSRARERVVALRATEAAVLDRLGFASYSDFMMGNSTVQVDPEKAAALDAAREALAAAEAEWHRLERATDDALARAAVLDHRRGLIGRARGLLSAAVPLGDVPQALRDLRVPATSADVSAARLQAALERAGVELGDEDLDHVELGLIADAWLSEVSSADARRWTTQEERIHVEDELRALQSEIAASASDEDGTNEQDPDEDWAARLTAVRERVDEAETRWLAHDIADERAAAIRADLDVATTAAHAARQAAVGAEEEVAAAGAALTAVVERERALEDQRARAAADETEVAASIEVLRAQASADPATLDAAIESALAAQRVVEDALDAEIAAVSVLDAEGQVVAAEVERLQEIVATQDPDSATEAEVLEWYLLARLAAQRSVSVAGSLPLLLDDALRGVDGRGVDHLLGRLERMAEAVQVIVISDDPVAAAWATAAGPARAAVVRPSAP